jgi:hypothetical protein
MIRLSSFAIGRLSRKEPGFRQQMPKPLLHFRSDFGPPRNHAPKILPPFSAETARL